MHTRKDSRAPHDERRSTTRTSATALVLALRRADARARCGWRSAKDWRATGSGRCAAWCATRSARAGDRALAAPCAVGEEVTCSRPTTPRPISSWRRRRHSVQLFREHAVLADLQPHGGPTRDIFFVTCRSPCPSSSAPGAGPGHARVLLPREPAPSPLPALRSIPSSSGRPPAPRSCSTSSPSALLSRHTMSLNELTDQLGRPPRCSTVVAAFGHGTFTETGARAMSDPSPPSGTTATSPHDPATGAGFLVVTEMRGVRARKTARRDGCRARPRPPPRPRPVLELDAAAARLTRPGSRASATRSTPGRACYTSSCSPGQPRTTLAEWSRASGTRRARRSTRPACARAPSLAERSSRRSAGAGSSAATAGIYRTAGSRPAGALAAGHHDAALGIRDCLAPRTAFATCSPPSAAPGAARTQELLAALVEPAHRRHRPSHRCRCSDPGRRRARSRSPFARASGERSCSPSQVSPPDRSSLANGLELVAVHLGVHRAPASGTRHVSFDRRLPAALVSHRRPPARVSSSLDDAGADRSGTEAWLYRPAPAASSSPAAAATPRHAVPGDHVVEVEALGPESGRGC